MIKLTRLTSTRDIWERIDVRTVCVPIVCTLGNQIPSCSSWRDTRRIFLLQYGNIYENLFYAFEVTYFSTYFLSNLNITRYWITTHVVFYGICVILIKKYFCEKHHQIAVNDLPASDFLTHKNVRVFCSWKKPL